jgi:hypothetical protein
MGAHLSDLKRRHKQLVWTKSEDSGANHIYEAVTCIACQRTHLVNFNTGRVLGNDKESAR